MKCVYVSANIVALFCCAAAAFAAPQESQPVADRMFPPPDGSTWVFFGDSITSQHLHCDYIEAFCQLRYPKLKLHFRNAGRGGSTFGEGLERFDADVTIWKPQIVSVEMGFNGPDTPQEFYDKMVQTIEKIIALGAKPVLTSTHPQNSKTGGSHTLSERAAVFVEVGREKGLPCVDQFTALLPRWQKNIDGGNKVPLFPNLRDGKPDGTHPGPAAHLLKAWVFLKALGATGEVSEAAIDAKALKTLKESGCAISDLAASDGGIRFSRLDEALPMAFDADAWPAVELEPQVLELSRYMLKVEGLPAGQYKVLVDGKESAVVDAGELAAGWNMTLMKAGPIREQLDEVRKLIRAKEGFNKAGEVSVIRCIGSARNMLQKGGKDAKQVSGAMADSVVMILPLDEAIHKAAQPVKREFRIEKLTAGAASQPAQGTTQPK